MLEQTQVDMQALANELVMEAKDRQSTEFNKLLRKRTRLIKAHIDKASLIDLVLILSAIGTRLSLRLPGSYNL